MGEDQECVLGGHFWNVNVRIPTSDLLATCSKGHMIVRVVAVQSSPLCPTGLESLSAVRHTDKS